MIPRISALTRMATWPAGDHLLLLFVLLLGTLVPLGAAKTYKYQTAQFLNPDPDGSFRKMVVNTNTQDVYIGGKNSLFRLNENLALQKKLSLGPRQDSFTCALLEECKDIQSLDTFVKLLAIDYPGNQLILCSTWRHGVCEKHDLTTLELTGEAQDMKVVSNNASASTVGFIAPGPAPSDTEPQPNVLYVAVTWSKSKSEAVDADVPAFSSRRLTDFELTQNGLFTKTSIVFENTQRQTFIVHYVYGFSSENFSYMLTVQRKDDQHYHSVIFRVCQQDPNFYSYVEVPLNCTHNDVEYNRLQVAYVAKPGRELALSLNIDTREDVLFGIFTADSPPHANSPVDNAALCVLPMNYVRKNFTANIRRCFNGTGSYGGGHLFSSTLCRANSESQITDDYCGASEANQPLQGELPIHSTAHMTFNMDPAINVSSLHVAVTDPAISKYTVAFIGTKNGTVLKVSLDSSNVYETVRVAQPGTEVKAMAFDDSKDSIYLLTENEVSKMATSNCSQYTSCLECVGAKDPYCGWCSKDYKCNQRSECHPTDVANGWLPYDSDQCPVIKEITPDKIHFGKARPLTINIQNVPNIPNFNEFKCVFSTTNNSPTPPSWTQANKLSTQKFQCYTPEVDKLPTIGLDGKDYIVMTLTVQMNGQELVQRTVTFFNCPYHTTCGGCASSDFSCTWCVKKHRCTDSKEKHCTNDNYIMPEFLKAVVQGSPTDTMFFGAQHCPSFETLDRRTEILAPAGTSQNIQLRGLELGTIDTSDLRCRFVLDQVKEVKATYTPDSGLIECDTVDFNYIQRTSRREVQFSLVWSGSNNLLGNKNGAVVVMYKCTALAETCGDCLLLNADYQCAWCDNTSCDYLNFCRNTPSQFQTKGDVCRDIRILSFSPKSGPLDGGTRVTIIGQNFGSDQDQISVNVGNTNCLIKEFDAPKKVVCEMDPSPRPTIAPITVKLDQYTSSSTENFQIVKPRVFDIQPREGPVAGGTIVTLMGEHLDAGFSKNIFIGQTKCPVIQSINATTMTCETPAEANNSKSDPRVVRLNIDRANISPSGIFFKYVQNPNITWVSRDMVIRSGGLTVNVSGEYLHHVQSPKMLVWYGDQPYSGDCNFVKNLMANMTCESPLVEDLDKSFSSPLELEFGFDMDNVTSLRKLSYRLGKLKVYPDPILQKFKNGEKEHQQNTEQLFINGQNLEPIKASDVRVFVGQAECNVTSVVSPVIMCKPPRSQPAALVGGGFPEVTVQIGQNLTFTLGVLRYDKQEELSQTAIIVIAVCVAVGAIIMIVICMVCLCKFRHNDDMLKKMKKEMDQLESRVANECKEAFAELQTDMSELASDLSGSGSIPFWNYRTYCMRVLFPGSDENHPVIRELELDYRHREDTERGLKLFFSLIRNKTFLLIFIRTLESHPDFYLKERVNVASLISVALQTQMEYSTEILKTLLAELIERMVENPNKVHPKLLLRRNESVAEKMLTNWFTFLLYKFLRECAGEPLFMLYGAMKQQVSKGPVDAVTGEARYCLSEEKLIRQQINFKSMVLNVMDVDVDRCSQPTHPVKVLDCDTISQVKEKILDAIYKAAPFSSRPPKEELDLVLFEHPAEWVISDKTQVELKMFPNKDTKRLVLSDEDNTTKAEGDCRRLNTLSHYKVPDGAYVALHPKQTSIYNMSIMSENSRFKDNSFYNRSPSLNRSVNTNNVNIDLENCKVYHLVRHQDAESNHKEGERSNKMVSEIYLPRLLVTKGTLQTFVDDLFERIFSTVHRGTVLPLAIKYMFDFLDDQALHHNLSDEVVHRWKSNSLPLRFWVNVIKNPDFAFDIYKSHIVDACLTVIGQTFMDCCSTNEHKLTKDSPSGKLLYAKDIPKYKQWVARYYQDIKIMPAISDQDMTAMLAEESRTHQNEFNTNAALLELYKYVRKYYDDIIMALEDDEFAKKSKLTYKLDQVAAAMEGTTVC